MREDGQRLDEEEMVDTVSHSTIATNAKKFQRLFPACTLDRKSRLGEGLKAALCQTNPKQIYSWKPFEVYGNSSDVETNKDGVNSKTINTNGPIQRPTMGKGLTFSDDSKLDMRSVTVIKHNAQTEPQILFQEINLNEPARIPKEDSFLCLSRAKEEKLQKHTENEHAYKLKGSFNSKDDKSLVMDRDMVVITYKSAANKGTLQKEMLEAGYANMIREFNDKFQVHSEESEEMDGKKSDDNKKPWQDTNIISSQMLKTRECVELGASYRDIANESYHAREVNVKTHEEEVPKPSSYKLHDVLDREKQYGRMVLVDEMLEPRDDDKPVNDLETVLCLKGNVISGDFEDNVEIIEDTEALESSSVVTMMSKPLKGLVERVCHGTHPPGIASTVLDKESKVSLANTGFCANEAQLQEGILITELDPVNVLDTELKATSADNGLGANEAQFQLGMIVIEEIYPKNVLDKESEDASVHNRSFADETEFQEGVRIIELDPINVLYKELEATSSDNVFCAKEAQFQQGIVLNKELEATSADNVICANESQFQQGIVLKEQDPMNVPDNELEGISAVNGSSANEAQFQQGIRILGHLNPIHIAVEELEASSIDSVIVATKAQFEQDIVIKEINPMNILDNVSQAMPADSGFPVNEAQRQQGIRIIRLDRMNVISKELEATSGDNETLFQQRVQIKELDPMDVCGLEAISADNWSRAIDTSEDQFQQSIRNEELHEMTRLADDRPCANEAQCQQYIEDLDLMPTLIHGGSCKNEAQYEQDIRIKELDPITTFTDDESHRIDSNETQFQQGIKKILLDPMQLTCLETPQCARSSNMSSTGIVRYWTITCEEPGRFLCYVDPLGNLQYGFCDIETSREAQVLWGLIESRICILSVQFLLFIITLCLGGFFDKTPIPPPT